MRRFPSDQGAFPSQVHAPGPSGHRFPKSPASPSVTSPFPGAPYPPYPIAPGTPAAPPGLVEVNLVCVNRLQDSLGLPVIPNTVISSCVSTRWVPPHRHYACRDQSKKGGLNGHLFCARNQSRTDTSFRTLPPESSASTNSAIRAFCFSGLQR